MFGSAAAGAPPFLKMATYPVHRETDVVLRDGRTVRLTPVRPADVEGILRLLRGMSERSLYLRFFSSGVDLAREASGAVDVDYGARYGLVASIGAEGQVVGHASLDRIDDERAEVAFTVADEYQGLGLGSIMLVGLAEHAVEQGIPFLEAEVMPENHRMLSTFRESGRPVRMRTEPGLITVELPSSLSEPALERFERGEQLAASAALAHFLRPKRGRGHHGPARGGDALGRAEGQRALTAGSPARFTISPPRIRCRKASSSRWCPSMRPSCWRSPAVVAMPGCAR